jgi:hypothetical protein
MTLILETCVILSYEVKSERGVDVVMNLTQTNPYPTQLWIRVWTRVWTQLNLLMFRSVIIGLVAYCVGCSPTQDQKLEASRVQNHQPPVLTKVLEDSTSLLFIYQNAQGKEERVTSVADIPQASRAQVRVVDLTLSPDQRRSRKFVQLFDLRVPAKDGTYPGRVVSRSQLEASLIRMIKPKTSLEPAQTQVKSQQPPITLYSAAWCGYCKKARAFLKKRKLKFIEHDIEKNRKAARELARKAKKSRTQTWRSTCH